MGNRKKKGTDLVILAVGPMVYTALEVASSLDKKGISIEVVNCRFIKPMDYKYLKTIISRTIAKVITVEEGVIQGGFGEGVSSFLLENGYQGELSRLGLPDSFVQHGSRAQILNQLSLDESGMKDRVVKFFNEVKEPQ